MKDTKAIILETALDLFNTLGLAKVTLRTIANTMGISQGNLNYHFKKREDIIAALYFQLVKNMDENMSTLKHTNNTLRVLFDISNTIMHAFYKYRFFLLDFVQIIRENKKIKKHYLELTKLREKQFLSLFHLLVDRKVMRKEILPNEYENLYKRFQILGDFWISSAQIVTNKLTKNSILIYSEIISQAIFPYLTDNGKKEYLLLISQEHFKQKYV